MSSQGLPNQSPHTVLFIPDGSEPQSPRAHATGGGAISSRSQIDAVDEAAHKVFSPAPPHQPNQERGGFRSWFRNTGRSGAQSALSEDPVASEPSRFSGMCNAVKNFFSSFSRPEADHNNSAEILSDSSAGDGASRSSADAEPGRGPIVASSHPREVRNKEKKKFNDAIEAAITDIKNLETDLPENANRYLGDVPDIYRVKAGRVIGEALGKANLVKQNPALNESQIITQLDNVGNSLKTCKKPTDSRFSNPVSDFTKLVGNLASWDERGFFNRYAQKHVEKYENNAWDRGGVFSSIAKFALRKVPKTQKLKDLNGCIHDTSKSVWLRGGAFLVAIIAVAIPVLSFIGRLLILAVAAIAQVFINKKFFAFIAIAAIGVGLGFGGHAVAALFGAGTLGVIIGSNICTGLSVLVITIGTVVAAYFKLRKQPQDQAIQSLDKLTDAQFAAEQEKFEKEQRRRQLKTDAEAILADDRLRNGTEV